MSLTYEQVVRVTRAHSISPVPPPASWKYPIGGLIHTSHEFFLPPVWCDHCQKEACWESRIPACDDKLSFKVKCHGEEGVFFITEKCPHIGQFTRFDYDRFRLIAFHRGKKHGKLHLYVIPRRQLAKSREKLVKEYTEYLADIRQNPRAHQWWLDICAGRRSPCGTWMSSGPDPANYR